MPVPFRLARVPHGIARHAYGRVVLHCISGDELMPTGESAEVFNAHGPFRPGDWVVVGRDAGTWYIAVRGLECPGGA